MNPDGAEVGFPTVAGLLLAAGAGRRFGIPKALVVFDGLFLAERGLSLLIEGGCEPVHVVLGASAAEIEATEDLSGAVVVRNVDWPTGMGSSLRVGLASLPETVDAVVVALVDQPLVGAEALHRLRSAHARGASIAVASYHGRLGNPVLLDRSTWAGVAEAARGDLGARAYFRAHPGEVTAVPCEDTGTADDIDTPEELAALCRSGAPAAPGRPPVPGTPTAPSRGGTRA